MPAISASMKVFPKLVKGILVLLSFTAHAQSLEQGIAEFQRGEYTAAAQTLERSPDSPHRRTFLALARAATGRCPEAAPALSTEFNTTADPDLRRLAGLGLVQCHFSQNHPADAWPVIEKLQVAFPDDADVLYQAARLYLRAWNDTVFRMYQKTPSSFRVNQLSAEILELHNKPAEAIAEYRKAIAKNPAALNLHYRLGRAVLMESHAPENLALAREQFEAELKLNPRDAVAEYQIAQILQTEQKRNEAAARLERALSLSPDFAEALVALGKLRLDANRPADAIPLLERAAKIQPRNEAAHYSLMLAYRNAGRMSDALREKAVLDNLQRPPEGEFTEFLKKLGEKPAKP